MTDHPDPTRCGAVTRGVTGLLHTCDLPPHPDERWHASSTGGVAWRGRDLCRSRYPRPHNADPHTRIVACTRLAGHSGDHEEVDTGTLWPAQLSTPLYPPPDAPTTGASDDDFDPATRDSAVNHAIYALGDSALTADGWLRPRVWQIADQIAAYISTGARP